VDRPVAQWVGKRVVDELVLLDEREAAEALGRHGYVKVVARSSAVDDGEHRGVGKRALEIGSKRLYGHATDATYRLGEHAPTPVLVIHGSRASMKRATQSSTRSTLRRLCNHGYIESVVTTYLRSLRPGLPRDVYVLQSGLVIAGVVVVSVGECLHDSIYAPLVTDLAPTGKTGRYMAASGLAWQLGFITAPAVSGVLLGAAPFAFWPIVAAIALISAAYVLRLETLLPPDARVTPHR
jgi:hypothetical protein